MSSSLLALVIAACMGIALGTLLSPPTFIPASIVGLSASALLLASRKHRYGRLAWLLLVLGVVGLGMLRAQVALSDVAIIRDELSEVEVEVVPRRPGVSEERWYGVIESAGSSDELEGAKIVAESPRAPRSSRYLLRGDLTPPPPARNPGAFDYGAYLRERGIAGVLEADEMRAIGEEQVAARLAGRVAKRLEDSGIHRGAAAMVRALSLGDRRGLREEDEEAMRRIGLAHLLAVSGMHVAMVGYVFRRGMGIVFGDVVAGGLAVCIVGGYAFLVGATPSVLRAAAVFAIYTLSEMFGRKIAPHHALAWAALILLIRDPFDAVEVGFQLSFAAAAAILLAHRAVTRSDRGKFATLLACSTAAWLATAPFLLYHFDRVAPLGLVLSPLVLPLFPVILAAAWMVAVGSLAGLGGSLLALLATPLTWMSRLSRMAAELAPTIEARTSWVAPAFLGVSVLVFMLDMRKSGDRLPAVPRRCNFICGVVVATLWLMALWAVWLPEIPDPGALRIVVFDVGQGDAILLETSEGEVAVVDVGPIWGDRAAIEYSLIPYLHARGYRKVDRAFITHGHRDHYGGLEALIEAMPVEEVAVGPLDGTNPAGDTSTATTRLRRGRIERMGAVNVKCLWPPEIVPGSWGLNPRSGVLSVGLGGYRILLAGDLCDVGERALLGACDPGELEADFIKVGHHGSADASGEEFLRRVGPDVAVLSVGYNSYGLPDPETVARLRSRASAVVSTRDHGAVIIESDGQKWKTATVAAPPPAPEVP
ncbi:MAG: DNA internalization-related competence protein ComEC/Rec2 [Bacillota bacterium]